MKIYRWLISIRLLPFLIAFISVTLDLLSTRIALKLGYVETRLFGNNILLSYSAYLGVVFVLQFLGNYLADRCGKQWLAKLGLILSYIMAMQPFIAVIHNLNMLA